jgi:chemotaxis protein methyltransferase CheR
MAGEQTVFPLDGNIRPLTEHEFAQFRNLAYQKFGLDLRTGKEQLVSARLTKKMRELNIGSFKEYYRHVTEDKTGDALVAMIDALTTNHTGFFREMGHFDFMRQTILPAIAARDRISIWSAASSTGEEPYSIAFCIVQQLGLSCLSKLDILASDISTKALAKAQAGVYDEDRFRDIKPEQLRSFLLRSGSPTHTRYMVRKEIRSAIEFRRLNLMEPITHGKTFPLIFCRNVMIYFDRPTQQDLVRRLCGCLEPGGYLFIGHAESLNGLEVPLKYIRPAIYCKAGKAESLHRESGK